MRLKLLTIALAALSVAACHGQVPPTTSQVTLTITAPSSCGSGSPACTYVYSQATVASATTACPATTGTAYAPVNQSSPASGLTFTYTPAGGTFVCLIAQTLQSSLVSVPSNVVGPETIPAQPTAPSLSGAVTVASNSTGNSFTFTAGDKQLAYDTSNGSMKIRTADGFWLPLEVGGAPPKLTAEVVKR